MPVSCRVRAGEGTPKPECVMERVASRAFSVMPPCWNYNDSMVASEWRAEAGTGERASIGSAQQAKRAAALAIRGIAAGGRA
jgi:hypothetical protein